MTNDNFMEASLFGTQGIENYKNVYLVSRFDDITIRKLYPLLLCLYEYIKRIVFLIFYIYIHRYSPMNGRDNAMRYTKRCNNLNYA